MVSPDQLIGRSGTEFIEDGTADSSCCEELGPCVGTIGFSLLVHNHSLEIESHGVDGLPILMSSPQRSPLVVDMCHKTGRYTVMSSNVCMTHNHPDFSTVRNRSPSSWTLSSASSVSNSGNPFFNCFQACDLQLVVLGNRPRLRWHRSQHSVVRPCVVVVSPSTWLLNCPRVSSTWEVFVAR